MKYVLIVQSLEEARKDAPPFIPNPLEGLYGCKAFGPYISQKDASDALRKFPAHEWNISVVPLRSLSEELENPYAAIFYGDSPQ